MTEKTHLTDAELDMLIDDVAGLDSSNEAFRKFARAVLAKWGTPPAVAGEPDYATFALWYADHIGDENKPVRDAALATYEAFATPQPTQAQTGAGLLTDEMVSKAGRALSDLYATECGIDKEYNWKAYSSDFIETAKLVLEAAHGIKGGQHGTNT